MKADDIALRSPVCGGYAKAPGTPTHNSTPDMLGALFAGLSAEIVICRSPSASAKPDLATAKPLAHNPHFRLGMGR
ncbi:hypothetical protein [Methylobacterium sp. OAE515]|uniref:hypothetical protein n=1 Tax=Methylobacterium sp. OAE515 TaxID=2817895 RepID=UPI00178AD1B0